jgi:hypothetical protein
MASVRSKDFGIYVAKQFRESVSEPSGANLYLTFGRVQPWTNDISPPQANTSEASVYEVWDNMVGGKRLTSNDMRHVVPRFDWSNNTVYVAYDHLTDSRSLKNPNTAFYVLTDDFNVYKCIANNYGAASTAKPSSTNPAGVFQTPDKYIWKYMYSLSAEDQQRFLTSSFMPIKTLATDDNTLQWQVQDGAVDGAINSIILTNRGSGYTSNQISVNIAGDGLFANAFATRNTTTSQIDSITIDNKGARYTLANVTIRSPVGSGANARVIINPPGGHGSDPLYELGGSYLMIDTLIKNQEGGVLSVENDYRQIAIIEDPRNYDDTKVMSNAAVSQLTVITMAESAVTTNYYEDEWVYQGSSLANSTFRGIVAAWDYSNVTIKLTNVRGVPTSDLLIGATSTTSRYVNSVLNPEMLPYSGKLLYIDNIVPIERSIDQNEEYKILLSF